VPFLASRQMARVAGIHVLTFWIVLVNGLAYEALCSSRPRRWAAFAAVLVIPIALGAWHLHRYSTKGNPTVRAALVQPSVRNDEKWDPEGRAKIFGLLTELTSEGVAQGATLVIWAETAAPCYALKDAEWGPVVQKIAREAGVPIFFGVPDYQVTADRRVTYTNTAALLDGAGRFVDRMDKIQLVPFGEHIP